MKKILTSLGIIGLVSVMAIGATMSYLSDTETSAGNVFTAGAIDLTVDNESYYNGKVSEGTTFDARDLDEGVLFINFTDLKPDDEGEDTISLHVNNNDAYLCMDMSLTSDDDISSNEPELKVDVEEDPDDFWDGELADLIQMIWWADDGDNVLEDDEMLLNGGVQTITDLFGDNRIFTADLADSTTNVWTRNPGPVTGSETYYIGKGWCFGTMTLEPVTPGEYDSPIGSQGSGFLCDGKGLGNESQTDGVTMDITFRAIQERHNNNFVCNPSELFCGNGTVEGAETCELPNTIDNSFCDQSTSQCVGAKLQTRDAFGNCGGSCGCVDDPWSNPVCSVADCSAGCDSNDDCDDKDPNTTDTCNMDSCGCEHTYVPSCGNGTVDSLNEQCDDGNTDPDDGCSATCQDEFAYLIVHKDVVNNDVGTKNRGDFQMTIDAVNAAQDVAISVAANVSHAVSEADTFGYVKTYGADCDTNGNVTVAYNQTKTCTVINTYPYFTVTVNKVLVNNDGGNAVLGDFNLFVGMFPVTSGVSKKVAVGSYLINESGVGGYDGRFTGDCDSNTQLLTGANGDNKICTITNDDIAPVITLVKNVIGSALPTDFIMRVNGVPVPSGNSKSVTSNTGHIISEDDKADYTFTSMTGIGSQGSLCPTSLDSTVTLNEGEVITCTITNTYTGPPT